MSRQALSRWTTVLGWAALMGIVWTLFVPGRVSVTTFVLLGLTGLVILIGGSALWVSSRPSPSMGEILGDAEADRTTATAAGRSRRARLTS